MSNSKLIGVAGAPGSGKTTMCRWLASLYTSRYNIECSTEYARWFIRTYGQPEHLGIQSQFCKEQKALEESAMSGKCDVVLSDSPTFLNYIYSLMMTNKTFNKQEHALLSANYNWILDDIRRYDAIILLPYRIPIDDGVRITDVMEVDSMIRGFVMLHNKLFKNLYVVESAPRQSQTDEIIKFLKNKLDISIR